MDAVTSPCVSCSAAPQCRTADSLIVGGLWIQPFPAWFSDKAGIIVEGHRHNQDHGMFIGAGAVRAEWGADGQRHDQIVRAGECLSISKDAWHTFTTLEPGTTAWCIFVLRDAQGHPTTTWDGERFWYSPLLSKHED